MNNNDKSYEMTNKVPLKLHSYLHHHSSFQNSMCYIVFSFVKVLYSTTFKEVKVNLK